MTHAFGISLLTATSVVTAINNMVHTHVPDKLAARRRRAHEKGYVVYKPSGANHILVHARDKQRVASMAASVALP